jgi:hypothetical protein
MTACKAGCTMAVNLMPGRTLRADARHQSAGWAAALDEFEHQAAHWDTPDHGETGHLIAEALRAAVDIARNGGLQCGFVRSLARTGDNRATGNRHQRSLKPRAIVLSRRRCSVVPSAGGFSRQPRRSRNARTA